MGVESEKSGLSKSWYEIVQPAWRLIDFDRRELWIIFVYVVCLGIVAGTVPFVSQIVVNQTAFTGNAQPIFVLSVVILAVMLIGAFVKVFQMRVIELLAKRIFVRTSIIGTKALLSSPSGKYDLDDREIANRFFDISTFQSRFAVLVSEGLGIVVVTLLGVLLLAFYHPYLLSFTLFVMIACAIIIGLFAKKAVVKGTKKSKEKYNVGFWVSEVAEHRSLLRQGHESKIVHGTTDHALMKYVRAHYDYVNILIFQGTSLFILQATASAVFFGLGGWLVLKGLLNLGQLVAAEIILLAILGALGKLNNYLDYFYDFVVSANKISDLTGHDREMESPELCAPASIQGLELRSPLLKERLILRPGDVIALRGEKKALCSGLMRAVALLDSDMVDVRLLGEDFVSRSSVAQAFLYLAQPAIMRMSLAENLTLLGEGAPNDSATSKIYQLPLLTAREKETADDVLEAHEIDLTDRARFSALRAFLTDRQVVLVDQFFNSMESADQVAFVRHFKESFPDRILVVHSFETAIDPHVSQVVYVKEVS